MKTSGLLAGDCVHGLQITSRGRKRLEKKEFDNLEVKQPDSWDQQWRIIFFDIPEEKKVARNALIYKMRQLGILPLQKSVWIHPYPCREVIEKVSTYYQVDKYITYIETSHIDKQELLIKRFRNTIS